MIRVLLLTAPNCELCEHAKAALGRIAPDYGMTVEELSTQTETGQKLMIEHCMAFPPGLFIDGLPFSYGRLSERKLRREIERRLETGKPQG